MEYKMYKKALHVDILPNLACCAFRNSLRLPLQMTYPQYENLSITFQQPHDSNVSIHKSWYIIKGQIVE